MRITRSSGKNAMLDIDGIGRLLDIMIETG